MTVEPFGPTPEVVTIFTASFGIPVPPNVSPGKEPNVVTLVVPRALVKLAAQMPATIAKELIFMN